MRIAHLTTVDMSHALLLATELTADVQAGHEVFAISAPGPYRARVDATGARFVGVPTLTRAWSPAQDAQALVDLVRTIRRLRLDVLHTHTPKAGVLGRISGRLAGVPVVVNTCHGLWAGPNDSLTRRAFVYGAEGIATLFSDFEFFQNANDAHIMRRVLRPGRYAVVGNGIDLSHFVRDPAGRERLRRELGVAPDQLLVGGVGRQVAEKGVVEFCEMAAALVDRARCVWVGPEDGVGAPPDPNVPVTFLGERADMRDVYSAFDIFVLPTYREGFSRAGMEAAACALPMVLTDIRGCREIGENNVHLLLVPPRDSDALTSAVRRLIDDPALRVVLGTAAEQRARTEFDQLAVARTSLRTYERVFARKRPIPISRTVLHIIPQDSRRGAQVYAARLRDELQCLPGQDHRLLTLFSGPAAGAEPDVALDCLPGLQRRIGIDLRAVAALRRYVRAAHPAVIVAHGGEPLKYAVLSHPSAPLVYYKVGLSTHEIARSGHMWFYRWLTRRVDATVAVSEAIAEQLRAHFEVADALIRVIPNGRDPQTYTPLHVRDQDGSPPLVLFVGQLEAGKRPELFLSVIEDVRATGLDFRAAMVGDGPLKAQLQERARALGVDLLGVRHDVPELLRGAGVLVMTSALDTEGMPGVVVEAGLSGIPVVSTPAAGVADVVRDAETGFLGMNAAELAEQVVALLSDAQERERIGKAARERCVQHFSMASSARHWAELIDQLAPLAAQEQAE